ncbi:hypothetical protein SAMN06265222_107147 [Neorhodopirellula lusitana]|uniref:Uncharacterized protein n=1 Tax=Neorhodopirellula lusitana TaxID=445327 RepID=A0ABY1Q6Z1_9BACT|nr:hypothetical protein [Neorhodopirellula lusitana]SMP61673.1 hypothetical protein SAMN06265222_107147 [Neorhodopirellula lusitana]
MSLTPSFSDALTSHYATSGSAARSSVTPVSRTGSSIVGRNQGSSNDDSESGRDRRRGREGSKSGRAGVERRQFGSTHNDLSDDGRELAAAIDAYKLEHHRRYITCDEMLLVIRELGYSKA